MATNSIDVQDIIYSALSNIPGNFSIYELTAGSINTSESTNFTIKNPAFYLTNFTDYSSINISDFYAIGASNAIFQNKEEFAGGVVALSFVISGVVTASWMLFLLLLLSANTIPNSLILANIFYSVCHTAILTKLTSLLRIQVKLDFTDTDQVQRVVTFSTASIIVKAVATLFIYISWIDLIIQMNKYERRKRIMVQGFILSGVSIVFQLVYGFLFRNIDHSSRDFKTIKAFHFLFDTLTILLFQMEALKFSYKKKKFAYHRRSLPLAIFSWIVLLTPYIFLIIDIASDVLRRWSSYLTMFCKLCVSIIIWEWLHTIRILETRHERRTVLGRRISNDSFTNKVISETVAQNNYLLRSLNIVAIVISLKTKFKSWCTHKRKEEQVSLYEMAPTLSRQSSEPSAVSLVGDYPQFNVDHRYLRNTPSTHRNTPINPDDQ